MTVGYGNRKVPTTSRFHLRYHLKPPRARDDLPLLVINIGGWPGDLTTPQDPVPGDHAVPVAARERWRGQTTYKLPIRDRAASLRGRRVPWFGRRSGSLRVGWVIAG